MLTILVLPFESRSLNFAPHRPLSIVQVGSLWQTQIVLKLPPPPPLDHRLLQRDRTRALKPLHITSRPHRLLQQQKKSAPGALTILHEKARNQRKETSIFRNYDVSCLCYLLVGPFLALGSTGHPPRFEACEYNPTSTVSSPPHYHHETETRTTLQ